jgi:hypothetical protein
MKKSHSSITRKPGRAGQSLVEFALVLPIFIALVFFLIDILRFYFIQQTLSYQVREGLRAGVVYDVQDPPKDSDGNALTRRQVIVNAVEDSNLYNFNLHFAGGTATANPDVIATLTPSDGGIGNTQVTLKMEYQNFVFLTPFIGLLFKTQPSGSIPLSISQSFQNESL